MLGFSLAGLFALGLLGWEVLNTWRQGPILIGFSGQLTGRYSDLGVQGRNGAQLAVEHINAAHGVLGRPLRLLAMDDLNTPEGALAADQALIDAGVVAIVGHMTSSQSMAALPLANATHTVLFSPTTSTPLLVGIQDCFFRNSPVSTQAAAFMAEYAYHNLNIERAAVIYDEHNAEFSLSYAKAFAERFQELAGTVVKQIAIKPNNLDADGKHLRDLTGQPIEALLIVASARDTASLAQHATLLLPHTSLLTSDWACSETLLRHAGPHMEGMRFALSSLTGEKSLNLEGFKRGFFERFGTRPTFAAERSYDAVFVLAEALRHCAGTREGLPEALKAIRDFQTLSGTLSLDEHGDAKSQVIIMRVQSGHFVRID